MHGKCPILSLMRHIRYECRYRAIVATVESCMKATYPKNDDIAVRLNENPMLLQLKSITERVLGKKLSFVETFIEGMAV